MESWMVEAVIGVLVAFVGWLAARGDKAQQAQIDAQKEAAQLQVKKHDEELVALDAKYKTEVAEQSEQIKLLFNKHDHDVASLQELRVKVAESYHKKPEIEERFKRLEDVMIKGFENLRVDLQKLFSRGQ